VNNNLIISELKSGWKSFKKKNICLRWTGKIIINNKFMDSPIELYDLFEKINFDDDIAIKKILERLDGFFTIIYETENNIIAINDRLRSYPIYFYHKANQLFISDNAYLIKEKFNLNIQNNNGSVEFLLSGYVTGNETLYKDLLQLLPGQYLSYDKKLHRFKIKEYFKYYPNTNNNLELSLENKVKEYKELIYSSFERLKDYIIKNKYQPIIPLSGGRDSRLMAVMLKEVGIENSIAFTYGTKEHKEVIKSKEIAGELGVDWFFCSYTKEKWHKEYNNSIVKKYFNYADGLSVRPHVLDYIAVKELFSKKKEKLLFLSGHSLDFIAGSHIPASLFMLNKPSKNNLYEAILAKHFSFHYIYKKERAMLIERISSSLDFLPQATFDEIISAFEYWDWRERQGKFILNALNVYDFFNFDWYLPFWERQWMNFFMQLPCEWRYKQNFQRYALHKLFPNYFEKEEWFCEKETKKEEIKRKFKRNLKKIILKIPLSSYYFRRNNYAGVASNYGVERYGAFDVNVNSLEEFAKKYTAETDISRIFYFFTLHYLLKNNFNLNFLDSKYKKIMELINYE
jgi:asparagine synthase (glutamine-hydrolysing)